MIFCYPLLRSTSPAALCIPEPHSGRENTLSVTSIGTKCILLEAFVVIIMHTPWKPFLSFYSLHPEIFIPTPAA